MRPGCRPPCTKASNRPAASRKESPQGAERTSSRAFHACRTCRVRRRSPCFVPHRQSCAGAQPPPCVRWQVCRAARISSCPKTSGQQTQEGRCLRANSRSCRKTWAHVPLSESSSLCASSVPGGSRAYCSRPRPAAQRRQFARRTKTWSWMGRGRAAGCGELMVGQRGDCLFCATATPSRTNACGNNCSHGFCHYCLCTFGRYL